MVNKIRVAILDDHPSIVDGYQYRLAGVENIEIVATAGYGDQLETLLDDNTVDLLLLDINVPTNIENNNPYPILYAIPRMLKKHPELNILVISMHNQRTLIQAIMDAGASGYILKDDRESIQKLGEIITSVNSGGIYFSSESYRQLLKKKQEMEPPVLTPRQQEVLSLCASKPEASTAELADSLNVAPSTVRNLLSNAYVRLGTRNRHAAVSKARQLGMITPESN